MHAVLIDFNFLVYSTHLANELAELCEVTLMLPDQLIKDSEIKVDPRIHLHIFKKPRIRYPTNLLMVRSLFGAVRKIKPDVIHQLAWNPWFNMALPLSPRVPFVTTIHDARRHPGEPPIPFYSWQWHRASQIIVHAESIKRQMVELNDVDSKRIRVIPIGPYTFYRALASDGIAEQENLILFFGRISEYKGLQYLIEAEPLISAQVPDVRIMIAGVGEPFSRYERMMVNRDKFIIHNYHIPDSQVASLFQRASVIVLPYLEASQSGVAAIAIAFGKPVVATRVGGIPEIIEDGRNGYLVSPRDPIRLAEAVVKLLKNPESRRKMSRYAINKVNAFQSWPMIARQTLDVYNQALAEGTRHWPW